MELAVKLKANEVVEAPKVTVNIFVDLLRVQLEIPPVGILVTSVQVLTTSPAASLEKSKLVVGNKTVTFCNN